MSRLPTHIGSRSIASRATRGSGVRGAGCGSSAGARPTSARWSTSGGRASRSKSRPDSGWKFRLGRSRPIASSSSASPPPANRPSRARDGRSPSGRASARPWSAYGPRTGRGSSRRSRPRDEHSGDRARSHRASRSRRGARRGQDQRAHRGVRVRGQDSDVHRVLGRSRHRALGGHHALRPLLRGRRRRDPADQRRARAVVPDPRPDHHHAADLRDALPHFDPHPHLPPLPDASALHQERERRRPRPRRCVDRDHGVRLPELRDRDLPRQQPEPDGLRVRRHRDPHGPGGREAHDRLAPAGARRHRDRVRVLRGLHARPLPRPAQGPRRHHLEPVPRPRRHARDTAAGRGHVHHPVHHLRRDPRVHRRREVLRRPRVRAHRPAAHRRGARDIALAAPGFWELTKRYWYQYTSLFAIIVFLVAGFSTITAIFWSIIVAILVSYIRGETSLTPPKLVKALAGGTKQVLSVAATTAVAGIAVGILLQTGLGLKISSLILSLGFGNLVATLVVSGIVLWVLGLSLPITATYLVAVPTVVPALITLGVPAPAAHMFVFYYAVLSEVSPPVALSPFAAAAITGGNPYKTMMLTWKYALPCFLVPFMFTQPDCLAILGTGVTIPEAVLASVSAAVGITALVAGVGGYLLRPTNLIERVLLIVGGVLLVAPGLAADVAGLTLFAIAVGLQAAPRLLARLAARRAA